MVLIPAGIVRMGNDFKGNANEDECPFHEVVLSAYYLYQFEVTNEDYHDFIAVTNYKAPSHWRNRSYLDVSLAHHPVVNVNWKDAKTYAFSVGKRLPTEAEQDNAAGSRHGADYPWGRIAKKEFANYDNPQQRTTQVWEYPKGKSLFDIWDMCGNVGEWVHDWYDPEFYKSEAEENSTGPESGSHKCYRGGGFHGNSVDIRIRNRHFDVPQPTKQYIGFRCAFSVPATNVEVLPDT